MKLTPLVALISLALLSSAVPRIAAADPSPAAGLERRPDGIVLARNGAFLKIQVCADDITRVAYARDRGFFAHPSSMVSKAAAPAEWQFASDDSSATLRTSKVQVRVDLASGNVSFFDLEGQPILAEQAGARSLDPATVQGAATFHIRQAWEGNPAEALYGLGQNQLGLLNIKGFDLELWQHNGTVAVPFLVSSRGYGLLWDNDSYTRFGDLREFAAMPAAQLFDTTGRPGGLTASYFSGTDFRQLVAQRSESVVDISIPDSVKLPNHAINPALPADGGCSVRWEGSIRPEKSGLYSFESFSNCGIRLWVDDHLVMDHWRQGWLPWIEIAHAPLEAGRNHKLKLEWYRDEGMPTVRLRWKLPTSETGTSLWSQVGDGIDYYFVYGPRLDGVIDAYRRLTGPAPMMPAWAFGLWQSRERYETAQQSLDVVTGFRSRGIPFDNIVQDWRYWPEGTWGSHDFDPVRFPDPDGWIKAVHDLHAHLMISVWGKFEPGTENFAAMRAGGFLYERNLAEHTLDWLGDAYTFYDAFNPGARKLLWEQMDKKLFRRGIDAWWMDATEPDIRPTPTLDGLRDYMSPTAMGPGSRVLNAYPLFNSSAVYEGQRASAPNRRVFILTRSAFGGQQRYSAATWSGDTSSTWTAMKKQIAAGLSSSISGLPYWTMDSGGFSVPSRFSSKDPSPEDLAEWRELNTRWFEFATFVPMLRVHGQAPLREMWEFGGESSDAYKAQLKYDRIRYRMLPYIYSLAGAVTQENGTFMRALVMDFPADITARDITDEYMFGPSLLVSPVTSYRARARSVYLPGTGAWYDFASGARFTGGQSVEAVAPFDAIPLYVKAGSILPAGPEIQFTGEKPADPLTLHVYAGADGSFTLYEDDGVSYDYEHGAFARIPLHWSDATHTLTIGARSGSFPGMLAERTFDLVLVSGERPSGYSQGTAAVDQRVRYRGDSIDVVLPGTVAGEAPAGTGGKRYDTGASDDEIRIGNITTHSGPTAAYGAVSRAEAAYFQMINDAGGINGRKIRFIGVEDDPAAANETELARRLVEQERVLLVFSSFGTACNLAIRPYLNDRKVPQLFVESSSAAFDDPSHYPWTMGFFTPYRSEGKAYASYVLKTRPGARIAVLYADDEVGREYLAGVREELGDRAPSMIVSEVPYEKTDIALGSQIATLQASNADVFLNFSIGSFVTLAIRTAYDAGWHPLQFIPNASLSVAAFLEPAGLGKARGIIANARSKNWLGSRAKEDPEVRDFLDWMAKYNGQASLRDQNNASGYERAEAMVEVLRRCGDDLTRGNVMRQASHLDLELGLLRPGIRVKTTPDDYQPIKQLFLISFNGKNWASIGSVTGY